MKGINYKFYLVFLLPILFGFISIFIGSYSELTPSIVFEILRNKLFAIDDTTYKEKEFIILNIRLPRVISAFLVGATLSSASVILQGLFRNPLLDPFILGISSGAAFGCGLALWLLPTIPIQFTAFIFAILAVFLAYILANIRGGLSKLYLILSGIIISAFFQALFSIIKLLVDPQRLQGIEFWLMGSFANADWHGVMQIAILTIPALFLMYLMRWRLNIMTLKDEEALALGIDIKKERAIFIVLIAITVSATVSVTGIIGWTGLVVANLLRLTIGSDFKVLLPSAMAVGAGFMVFADTIARSISEIEIPVGIITAILGAPFFIYLMRTVMTKE